MLVFCISEDSSVRTCRKRKCQWGLVDNDIGLKGLKRPRLYRRTTTCFKAKTLLWKNCFQDIRHGFFGGLDLSVEKFFMAVFYNFPHRLKGLRKTKKRRNCTRKSHIEKTSYLVPVRGCPYYVIPDRFRFLTILSSCEWCKKLINSYFLMWIYDNVFPCVLSWCYMLS